MEEYPGWILRALAGNGHDVDWSRLTFCIPCLPCSCPTCPTESFWVRPVDWPALPSIAEGEEKVVGLVAVEDTDLEVLAVLCRGAYTVDWGDGSAPENFATGVKGQHRYTYASLAGDPLSRGYKTVTVVITPQAGNNLTDVDLVQRHSDAGNCFVQNKWLDVSLRVPNCDYIFLDAGSGSVAGRGFPRLLEQVTILEHAITDAYEQFYNCYSLMSVPLFDTSAITEMYAMFWGCRLLQSIPLYDTSSVTDMDSMFESCQSLVCIPELDTSNVTWMYGMFDYCYSLPCVPLLDTSLVESMEVMFNYCVSISCLPSFNTASLTRIFQMFMFCPSLTSLPVLDLSKVAGYSGMYLTFSTCHGLFKVPDFDTGLVNSIRALFEFCESLTIIPALDCSSVGSGQPGSNTFVRVSNAISKCKMYNRKYGVNTEQYNNKPLSAAALNDIFTNLGTAIGTQYVVITGCYGAADPACDRTIATAKGWTVIG